jgi:hypothetical protein
MAMEMPEPQPEFEVPQFYETSIAMRYLAEELGREFRFLCLPAAAIHEDNRHLLGNPPTLLSELLELGEPRPLRVAQLPDAILTLLRLEVLGQEAGSALDLVSSAEWLDRQRGDDPDAALFAEYLAFAEVVPFEQSKATVSPLATQAMKSYGVATGLAGASPGAVILGPHGPVVFMAGAGALAVIDSIGVIIGVATSPRTAEIIKAARRGFRRLIHRAPSDAQGAGEPSPPSETLEQAEERVRQQEAERVAREHRTAVERRRRQKGIANTRKVSGAVLDIPPGDLGE